MKSALMPVSVQEALLSADSLLKWKVKLKQQQLYTAGGKFS